VKLPFDVVVERHGATVLLVARAVVGPVDADDAWSETFLAALRAYPGLPETANLEAWLVTIAHRKAIDILRARSRERARRVDWPIEDYAAQYVGRRNARGRTLGDAHRTADGLALYAAADHGERRAGDPADDPGNDHTDDQGIDVGDDSPLGAALTTGLITLPGNRTRSHGPAAPRGPAALEATQAPDPGSDEALDAASRRQIWSVVATLPDRQRQCLAYHYLGGLTFPQIAELLGGTADAARRAAADGRRALAGILSNFPKGVR